MEENNITTTLPSKVRENIKAVYSLKGEENIYEDVLLLIAGKIVSNPGDAITREQFSKAAGISERVVDKHIRYMVETGLTDRSGLLYDGETKQYKTYKYVLPNMPKLDEIDLKLYRIMRNKKELEKYLETEESFPGIQHAIHMTTIDSKLAYKALKNKYGNDLLPDDEKYKTIVANMINILSINADNNIYLHRGQKVNRLYSTITSLSGVVHDHIYINKRLVSEIDAISCQLMLMSLLTKDIESTFHEYVKDGKFYFKLFDMLKDEVLEKGLRGISIVSKDGLGHTYRKTINIDILKVHDKGDDYTTFKGWVYGSIFSGFTNGTTISKVMKERFANIVTALEERSKLEGAETLAAFMQNKEAEIWVNTSEVLNLRGVLNLPKHDGLLFIRDDKDTVEKALREAYTRIFGETKEYNLFAIKEREPIEKVFTEQITIEEVDADMYKAVKRKQTAMGELGAEAGRANADKTVYTFKNTETGEEFTGIKSEFSSKYALDKKNVNKVIKGELKQVKRWILA